MGGGVDQGVIESVDFAAEGLRIPGLRLLRRVEGLSVVPGAAFGRFWEAFSEHFGAPLGVFRRPLEPFLGIMEPTRATKDENSM